MTEQTHTDDVEQSEADGRAVIATLPWRGSDDSNPYTQCFYNALEWHGFEVDDSMEFENRWISKHTERVDAIHTQWPEYNWPRRGKASLIRRWRLIEGMRRFFRKARREGIITIGTVHNSVPHESCDALDKWGMRTYFRGQDLLICHSTAAVSDLAREYHIPPSRCTVVRHGSYEGCYPTPSTSEDIAKRLNLKLDVPIFCSLGAIREYKGIHLLLAALQHITTPAQFVIAGPPTDSEYTERLRVQCGTIDNCTLLDRELSPQEFIDILAVSRATILPYTRITGSGALAASWTAQTFAITSNLPYFEELLAEFPGTGVSVEVNCPEALAHAIEKTARTQANELLKGLKDTAGELSWRKCVAPLVRTLRQVSRDAV